MASPIHDDIRAFLTCRRIALVGFSTDPEDFSCAIREKFEEAGFEVFGVNPRLEADPDARNYPDLGAIPAPPVEAAFLTTTPEVSEDVVKQCHSLGITMAWMHQNFGPGSVSKQAVRWGRQNGMTIIDRGCPMMFVSPVDWFHKTMRFVKGMHAVPNPSHPAREVRQT
jgi:predicted CoA-binding protein